MRASVRTIATDQGPARAHVRRPADATRTLVLGQGAGGGFGALDLRVAREVFLAHGWVVVFVEQPWLVAGRKVAGRPPTLDAAWVPVVDSLFHGRAAVPRPFVLGGRSAGARVACRTGAALGASGSLLVSFPLHLPGRSTLRDAELAQVVTPAHLVQGESDTFGTPTELAPYLPTGLSLHVVPGAHSFRDRARPQLEQAFTAAANGLSGITG